jgi:hypothetical protein
MKHFRRFRDDRFALTTLQNPLCEVRTRAELIQAAQQALQHQPDVAEIPPTPPPAAAAAVTPPITPAAPATGALAPQNPPDDETPQPPNLHGSKISLSVREPVRKAAKPRSPRKTKRYTKPRHLAKVVPSDDAAEYVAKVLDAPITNASLSRRDHSDLTALDYHARKCLICNHPDRADLEEDFVSWRNIELIQKDYELPNFRAVYRHARATGLFQRRRENLRFAAELLIEHADQAQPSPDAILRAIQVCARLNDTGEWVEPVKRVIFSSGGNASAPEPASQYEPQFDPQYDQTSRRESALPQLAPESAPHPQLSAPISISTDEPNPHFPIDTNGD